MARLVIRFLDTTFSEQGEFNVGEFVKVIKNEEKLEALFKVFDKTTKTKVSKEEFLAEALRLLEKVYTKNTVYPNERGYRTKSLIMPRSDFALKSKKQVIDYIYNTEKHTVDFIKEPMKMLKNIDLAPMLDKMFSKQNMFATIAHGTQLLNKPFTVPDNVAIVLVGSMGLPLTNPQVKLYLQNMKSPSALKQMVTNPLWRRKSDKANDLYRNRIYVPPRTEMNDIVLQFHDNYRRTMGLFHVFDYTRNVKALTQDFLLMDNNETQKRHTLLDQLYNSNYFDENMYLTRDITLSQLVFDLSVRGGGILIPFNCRNLEAPTKNIQSLRRIEKKVVTDRRKNIDLDDVKQLGKLFLQTKKPVLKIAGTNNEFPTTTDYVGKLLRAYKLGRKTTKTFNGWTHSEMKFVGTQLRFKRVKGNETQYIVVEASGASSILDYMQVNNYAVNMNHNSTNGNDPMNADEPSLKRYRENNVNNRNKKRSRMI